MAGGGFEVASVSKASDSIDYRRGFYELKKEHIAIPSKAISLELQPRNQGELLAVRISLRRLSNFSIAVKKVNVLIHS